MKTNRMRFLCKLLCIALVASFTLEAPLMASPIDAIRVNVGGQQVQVSPGQWVSVRQGTQITHYNVRYVDGKPMALEMSQYVKLIFGGGSVPAGSAGSTAGSTAQSSSTSSSSSAGSSAGASTSGGSASTVSGSSVSSTGGTKTVSTPVDSSSAGTSGASSNVGTVADNSAAGQSTAAPTSNWDPAAHPRDPATGRFVSASGNQNTSTAVSGESGATVNAGSSNVSNAGTTTTEGGQTVAAVDSGSPAPSQPSSADTNVTGAAQSGEKGSGSWVKDELSGYGQKIKDSYNSGKETGNNVGTKTVDGAKKVGSAVGNGVKSTGSKIGDLLRGAKERITKIFHKKPAPAKTDQGQAGEQPGQGDKGQPGQSDQGQAGQGEQNGQAGQGEQAGQAGQGEQNGQAGQGEQAGQAGQGEQAGQAGQGEQAGQTGQTGQAGKDGKPGFKELTGEKFKKGYMAGKEMTNQGFQNVKSTFKAGFSPKGILTTAAITVGVDLASQMLRGEKPSLKKAVKIVASAEFAGGVVGGVTGAAAGSFFVPFLSAIPVVGGVLSALAPTFGSIVGGTVGSYLAGDLKNGRFSIKQAFKQIDWIGVGGQTIGSTAGAALGSLIFPPFGTIIGGIVGGYLGNLAAHKIAKLFGKDKPPAYAGSTPMPVGTNPYGYDGTSISIGGVAGGAEIPVSGDQGAEVTVSGSQEPIGTYGSEVQLAYAKYQELYKLYNEMLTQGRQEDAMKVANEMNKAKAEFDTLKAAASK